MAISLFEENKEPGAIVDNTDLQVFNEIVTEVSQLPAKYTDWEERKNKCITALSVFTAIDTDEDDAKAAETLAKVRATFELINKGRIAFTGKWDNAKKILMGPENAISTDAKNTTSEYNRVRNMRNKYAQDKLDKQKKAEADALAEKNRKEEITRLKGVIEQQCINGITMALSDLNTSMIQHLSTFTLENFEDKAKRFSLKPKLSTEKYEAFLTVTYNKNILPVEDFNNFMSQVRAQFTYDKINGEYETRAIPEVDKFKEQLPEAKKRLEDIKALRQQDETKAKEAEQQLAVEQQKKKDEIAQSAATEIQTNNTNIEQKQARENLSHSFNAQVQIQQSQADLKNTRTKLQATITAAPENLIVMMSDILYGTYTNPEFPGFVKLDKETKLPLFDNDGRPVYNDFIETMLQYYIDYCEHNIAGIELKELGSTSARIKK